MRIVPQAGHVGLEKTDGLIIHNKEDILQFACLFTSRWLKTFISPKIRFFKNAPRAYEP